MWHRWKRREIEMVLVGTPEGKRPLERPRCWWKDNIKVEVRETGWKGVEGCHENGNESVGFIKCREFFD
jgi:hypothetical protein